MLAGQVKLTKGKLPKKLKISYKAQHITAEKGQTVRTILLKTNKKAFSQQFKIDVVIPLELDALMEKKLNELSGGELQRAAIAVCLARDADLYLLDEPSTYLDVEQRLMAAQAIKRVAGSREVAALVVDHDLMFINHISDKLLPFTGEPAKNGHAKQICGVNAGMNNFLKELGITCRKDPETGRPRVNKEGSVKDKAQKRKGKYYL
jgi:ATP-binding cassette subfamily E protein 1